MNTDAGGVSASNEGLGPLPERRIRHVYNESKGYECDCWTEDAVREYALAEVKRAVAAERERCADIVDKYGPSDFNDLREILVEIRVA